MPLTSDTTVDPIAVLDALPDLAFVLDSFGCLVFANDTCSRVLGWGEEALGWHALELVHPDDQAVVATSMTTIPGKRPGSLIEFRLRCRGGGWRWVELVGSDWLGTPGLDGYVCVARDISLRRQWEIAGDDIVRFEQAFQHGAALTVLLDGNGHITGTNNAFNRVLGHDKSVAIGNPLADFVVDEHRKLLREALVKAVENADSSVVELSMPRAAGLGEPRLVRFEIRSFSPDSSTLGFVASGQDITELDAMRTELERLAHRDSLTGVANRKLMERTIHHRLEAGDLFAVLYVDLVGFKRVNDVFGHRIGDRLLESVANRLAMAIGSDDMIARVGGDEFVIVLDAGDDAEADRMAELLKQTVQEPFLVAGRQVTIAASIGHAISHLGITSDELIDEADAAMYRDKRSRTYVDFA